MGKTKRPSSILAGLPASILQSFRESSTNDNEERDTHVAVGEKRAADQAFATPPPAKKRKVVDGLLGPGYEKYDATGLVPFYKKMKDVPDRLKKCK